MIGLSKRVPRPSALAAVGVAAGLLAAAPAGASITVTQTTSSSALSSALGGTGLTINSATVANGNSAQFGTYSGFNGSVITLANGVVLSSGQVVETATPSPGSYRSTDFGVGSTAEFTSYGSTNVTNFSSGHDVATLKIDFTLATASAISFSFVFGSMEYPVYVSSYTDAFMTFLDGTSASNQIVFDSNNKPVQVGSSFASTLTTADTSTAFTSPQGLVGVLTTTTGTLAAGAHTLLFEVGDVNDGVLDSAVFLTGLQVADGTGGGPVTNPGGPGVPAIPEPSTYALMLAGLTGIGWFARRRSSGR